jgi:hypothetical protein
MSHNPPHIPNDIDATAIEKLTAEIWTAKKIRIIFLIHGLYVP